MFIIGGGCMNILVGVSNRHVHLTKNIYDKLFSSPMEKLRDLDQPGQFASKQILSIKVGDKIIDDVRVVGPLRDYNQVEISRTDAYFLKVNPPIRESGDIKGSSPITLITSLGEVYLDEGLIIANRHVHLTKDDVEKYGLYNIKEVAIKIKGEKSGIIRNVYLKVQANASLRLHLDTDDANAFNLKNGDEVEVLKIKEGDKNEIKR